MEEFLKLEVSIEARTHETIYGTDDRGDEWEDEESSCSEKDDEFTVKDIITNCDRYYANDDRHLLILEERIDILENTRAIETVENGDITEVTVHANNILPALCDILREEYQDAINSGYLSDNFPDISAKEESGVTSVYASVDDFGETDEAKGFELSNQLCLAISDIFKDKNYKFNISGKLTETSINKDYKYY